MIGTAGTMSIEKHPYWSKAVLGDAEALTFVSADAVELNVDLALCRDLLLRHEPILNPSAWYNLGLIFQKLGILDRAQFYLRKAADSGHVHLIVPYALMVRGGEFGNPDPKEASAYLVRASSHGSIQAKLLLLGEERDRKGFWFLPAYIWKRIVLSGKNARLYTENPGDPRIHKYSKFEPNIENTWPNWQDDLCLRTDREN